MSNYLLTLTKHYAKNPESLKEGLGLAQSMQEEYKETRRLQEERAKELADFKARIDAENAKRTAELQPRFIMRKGKDGKPEAVEESKEQYASFLSDQRKKADAELQSFGFVDTVMSAFDKDKATKIEAARKRRDSIDSRLAPLLASQDKVPERSFTEAATDQLKSVTGTVYDIVGTASDIIGKDTTGLESRTADGKEIPGTGRQGAILATEGIDTALGLAIKGRDLLADLGGFNPRVYGDLIRDTLPIESVKKLSEDKLAEFKNLQVQENQRRAKAGLPSIEQENDANLFNRYANYAREEAAKARADVSLARKVKDAQFGQAAQKGLMAAIEQGIDDPTYVVEKAIESSPFLLAGGPASRALKAVGASEAAAVTGGTIAIGALDTAQGAQQAKAAVNAADMAELAKSDAFQKLKSANPDATPAQLREVLAMAAENKALGVGLPLTALLAGVSTKLGLNPVETAVSGGAKKFTALGAVGSVLKEAAGEFPEEAGNQYSQNVGEIAGGVRSPDKEMEGVLGAGAMGAMAGGATSVGVSTGQAAAIGAERLSDMRSISKMEDAASNKATADIRANRQAEAKADTSAVAPSTEPATQDDLDAATELMPVQFFEQSVDKTVEAQISAIPETEDDMRAFADKIKAEYRDHVENGTPLSSETAEFVKTAMPEYKAAVAPKSAEEVDAGLQQLNSDIFSLRGEESDGLYSANDRINERVSNETNPDVLERFAEQQAEKARTANTVRAKRVFTQEATLASDRAASIRNQLKAPTAAKPTSSTTATVAPGARVNQIRKELQSLKSQPEQTAEVGQKIAALEAERDAIYSSRGFAAPKTQTQEQVTETAEFRGAWSPSNVTPETEEEVDVVALHNEFMRRLSATNDVDSELQSVAAAEGANVPNPKATAKRFKDMKFTERWAIARQLRETTSSSEFDAILEAIGSGNLMLRNDPSTTAEGVISKKGKKITVNMAEFVGKSGKERRAAAKKLRKEADRSLTVKDKLSKKARKEKLQAFYLANFTRFVQSSSSITDAIRHEFTHAKDLFSNTDMLAVSEMMANNPLWAAATEYVNANPATRNKSEEDKLLETNGYYMTALSSMANDPQFAPLLATFEESVYAPLKELTTFVTSGELMQHWAAVLDTFSKDETLQSATLKLPQTNRNQRLKALFDKKLAGEAVTKEAGVSVAYRGAKLKDTAAKRVDVVDGGTVQASVDVDGTRSSKVKSVALQLEMLLDANDAVQGKTRADAAAALRALRSEESVPEPSEANILAGVVEDNYAARFIMNAVSGMSGDVKLDYSALLGDLLQDRDIAMSSILSLPVYATDIQDSAIKSLWGASYKLRARLLGSVGGIASPGEMGEAYRNNITVSDSDSNRVTLSAQTLGGLIAPIKNGALLNGTDESYLKAVKAVTAAARAAVRKHHSTLTVSASIQLSRKIAKLSSMLNRKGLSSGNAADIKEELEIYKADKAVIDSVAFGKPVTAEIIDLISRANTQSSEFRRLAYEYKNAYMLATAGLTAYNSGVSGAKAFLNNLYVTVSNPDKGIESFRVFVSDEEAAVNKTLVKSDNKYYDFNKVLESMIEADGLNPKRIKGAVYVRYVFDSLLAISIANDNAPVLPSYTDSYGRNKLFGKFEKLEYVDSWTGNIVSVEDPSFIVSEGATDILSDSAFLDLYKSAVADSVTAVKTIGKSDEMSVFELAESYATDVKNLDSALSLVVAEHKAAIVKLDNARSKPVPEYLLDAVSSLDPEYGIEYSALEDALENSPDGGYSDEVRAAVDDVVSQIDSVIDDLDTQAYIAEKQLALFLEDSSNFDSGVFDNEDPYGRPSMRDYSEGSLQSASGSFSGIFKHIRTRVAADDVNALTAMIADRATLSAIKTAAQNNAFVGPSVRNVVNRSAHRTINMFKLRTDGYMAKQSAIIGAKVAMMNRAMDNAGIEQADRTELLNLLISIDENYTVQAMKGISKNALMNRYRRMYGDAVLEVFDRADELRQEVDSAIDRLAKATLGQYTYDTAPLKVKNAYDALIASKQRYLHRTYHKFSISSGRLWKSQIDNAIDVIKRDGPTAIANSSSHSAKAHAAVLNAANTIIDSWNKFAERGTPIAHAFKQVPSNWRLMDDQVKLRTVLEMFQNDFMAAAELEITNGSIDSLSPASKNAGALKSKKLDGPENKVFRELLGENRDYGRVISETIENQLVITMHLEMMRQLRHMGILVDKKEYDSMSVAQRDLYVAAPSAGIFSAFSSSYVLKDYEYAVTSPLPKQSIAKSIREFNQASKNGDYKGMAYNAMVGSYNAIATTFGLLKMFTVFTSPALWSSLFVGMASFSAKATASPETMLKAAKIADMWKKNQAGAPIDKNDELYNDYMFVMGTETIDSAVFAELTTRAKDSDYEAALAQLDTNGRLVRDVGFKTAENVKDYLIATWTKYEAIPKVAAALAHRDNINAYNAALGKKEVSPAFVGEIVRREFPSAKDVPAIAKFSDSIGVTMFAGFYYQTIKAGSWGIAQNVNEGVQMYRNAGDNQEAKTQSVKFIARILAGSAAQFATVATLAYLARALFEMDDDDLTEEQRKLKKAAEATFTTTEDPDNLIHIGFHEDGTPIFVDVTMMINPLDVRDALFRRSYDAMSPENKETLSDVLFDQIPYGFVGQSVRNYMRGMSPDKNANKAYDRLTNAGMLRYLNNLDEFGFAPGEAGPIAGALANISGIKKVDPAARLEFLGNQVYFANKDLGDKVTDVIHDGDSYNKRQMQDEIGDDLEYAQLKARVYFDTVNDAFKKSGMSRGEFIDVATANLSEDRANMVAKDIKSALVSEGEDYAAERAAYVSKEVKDYYNREVKKGLLATDRKGPLFNASTYEVAAATRNKTSFEAIIDPKTDIKPVKGTVTGVHDADTVYVTTDTGRQVKVRVQNIDAFELKQKLRDGSLEIGKEGQRFLQSLLQDQQVTLFGYGYDDNGRMIARVMTKDGKDAGIIVAEEGYAILTDISDLEEYPTKAEELDVDAPSVDRQRTK